MKIAIGGILHETNSFIPAPTDLAAFEEHGEFPSVLRGPAMLERLQGQAFCVGGMMAEAAAQGLDLAPLIWTFAQPSGTVRHAAYLCLRDELLAALRATLPVDGVLLDLHGAMLTDQCEDAEGDLIEQVRAAVGPETPVMVTLDLHANVTARMARLATALIGYDTYPHVDCAERGAEAARLMAAAVRKAARPVSGFRQVDMLIGPPRQCTMQGPMAEAFRLVRDLERRPGILNVTLSGGFPFSDIRDAGVSVTVTADGDAGLADRTAAELAAALWEKRREFRVALTPLREAIDYALKTQRGPVILADGSDNPGGGSPSDGTVMLDALVKAGVPSAAVACICDPEAVAAAHRAGAGNRATLVVGGKSDTLHGPPLTLTGVVRWAGEKQFTARGPMRPGLKVNMGRTAVFVVHNVEIVLTERRFQPFDCEALRCLGIEPRDRLLIGLKSAVHFRADYQPLAARIFEVDTPGAHCTDLARFTYRRVRRPIYPLDNA